MGRPSAMNVHFLLEPSSIQGVGVFAAHSFKKGQYLPLFAKDERVRLHRLSTNRGERRLLDQYCVQDSKNSQIFHCPADFTRMSVGWYLNHSDKPNAAHRNYEYFALSGIRKGEEVTIDYRTLNEASSSPKKR
jgi:SET domain-containing protein